MQSASTCPVAAEPVPLTRSEPQPEPMVSNKLPLQMLTRIPPLLLNDRRRLCASMTVTVKLKKRDDNGELTNEISAWARKDAAAGVPQQASATGAAGAPATPPWLRR